VTDDDDRDFYGARRPMTKQDKIEEIRRLRQTLESVKPKNER
jgi:hypothetical protein